jgi:hypothetical protein
MGRLLGAHDYNENFDRPELNKCPDCECFFAGDNCPICGKLCPEEMRAGNRKPPNVKKKKHRRSNGRVVFIDWYHSWWFILLMLIVFPLAGIVLLITSPHKKSLKIAVGIVAGLYMLLSSYGISNIVYFISGQIEQPVDTSLTREEYMAACEEVTPEVLYRSADSYTDAYITTTVTVVQKITDFYAEASKAKYPTYYLCEDPSNPRIRFLIRDCQREDAKNFLPGDVICVYGEVAGNLSIEDTNYDTHTAPGINGAYLHLVK